MVKSYEDRNIREIFGFLILCFLQYFPKTKIFITNFLFFIVKYFFFLHCREIVRIFHKFSATFAKTTDELSENIFAKKRKRNSFRFNPSWPLFHHISHQCFNQILYNESILDAPIKQRIDCF
jgi:hypothetical protein